MADELKRMTTEYSQAEDRIRITGENAHGQALVLWMTQRLMSKLVAHLCETLAGQDHGEARADPRATAMNHFAQQAATASLMKSAQPPVLARPDTTAYLVLAVDITRTSHGVRLLFKEKEGGAERSATIRLDAVQLRQWLAILRGLYGKASWPLDFWPEWVGTNRAPASAARNVVLH